MNERKIAIIIHVNISLPIRNVDNNIEISTNKSFVCPWYCYPAIIFIILICLIILTICISACDYRSSKKQQETNIIKQKTVSLENKDDDDKKTIDSMSQKVMKKSQDDDAISLTSTNSDKK
ncbi:unnamed protein product [Rotaria sp. Silwood2]|nr:unnamed protein product [Rotaria sp. Silwood2]CAF3156427.1 unnamed protein product [Rotaria sp. Silwood2]CAF3241544.1 unnamed protein product [Rotaria sp. Silwood2]CAF3955260.1 unnamed protein product [Rotaria sp. Silwood2]CAF3955371.1 unnamed protein product [Rotaria sp. Silwood2]